LTGCNWLIPAAQRLSRVPRQAVPQLPKWTYIRLGSITGEGDASLLT
jgi:hypothetical protein